MSLILKVPGMSFDDASIPILQRDQVANPGTLDIFDALDSYSWAKQGDPTEGFDTWKSMIGTVPNEASFAGAIGWDAGFTTDNIADIINLPSAFKRPADGSGVVIFWTKVGTQAFSTSNGIIAIGGSTAANAQFLAYIDHGTTDANTFIAILDAGGTQQILIQQLSVLPASKVAQMAVSFEPEGGGYRLKSFLNGLRMGSYLRANLATLPQPAAAVHFGGTVSGYANAYTGTHLRAVVDGLSETTPEAFVALDYAANAARFE